VNKLILSIAVLSFFLPAENKKIQLVVSAAASLCPAFEEVKPLFEGSASKTGRVELIFNYGSSGSLSQQILNGASVDLFFSASPKQVAPLIKAGLVKSNEAKAFLNSVLVLVVPSGKKEINTLSDLTSTQIRSIAIGEPKSVPAGQYAYETLVSQKIETAVKDKLVFAKDVTQVLTYVESQNVDAGFVYLSDALLSSKVQIVMRIDPTFHSRIEYAEALIATSLYPNQTTQFLVFLKTNVQVRSLFIRRGFTYSE
jgi:molybdate transport system substrate-binding protein